MTRMFDVTPALGWAVFQLPSVPEGGITGTAGILLLGAWLAIYVYKELIQSRRARKNGEDAATWNQRDRARLHELHDWHEHEKSPGVKNWWVTDEAPPWAEELESSLVELHSKVDKLAG
jgi:hypothetical protein